MATAATELRGEGTTLRERENWSAGELQGARGKLTMLKLVEERGWRGLSTLRSSVRRKKLVGDAR